MVFLCVIPFSLGVNCFELVVKPIKLVTKPIYFIMNDLEAFEDGIKFVFPKHDNLLVLHLHFILTAIALSFLTLFFILPIMLITLHLAGRSVFLVILLLPFLEIDWYWTFLLLVLSSWRGLLESILHLELWRRLARLSLPHLRLVRWRLLIVNLLSLIVVALRLLARIKRRLPHLF